MDKPEVGLPQNFSIKVQKPVEIGDYLDETTIQPTPKLAQADPTPLTTEQPSIPEAQSQQAKQQNLRSSTRQTPSQPVNTSAKRRRKPRRQINMSPETFEKFNDIIAHVQDFGPQSDATASEIWEAIVNAHHEALPHLRFGSVRSRGPWGSPTANAFKHALSRAFTKAIVDFYSQ